MTMTTVGILGGGQLGRMLALAGFPLGLRFRFFDTSPEATAGQLAELHVGDYGDTNALDRFAAGLDVVTYEWENVPAAAVRYLAERVPVYPPLAALETAQDRLVEKQFFNANSIPTPRFVAVDDRAGLDAAVAELGLPSVLKTRRDGYDGKGQVVLREAGDLDTAWDALGQRPLILESFVPFDREVAIIAARGRDGQVAVYPPIEIVQREGILRSARVPRVPHVGGEAQELEQLAMAGWQLMDVLNALDYVGVLAVELFVVGNQILGNELAPRVHNSGHWTIEGAQTSQFEQHLRAILGLPLGPTEQRAEVAMLNLIGDLPNTAEVLAIPDTHLHLYGKTPRPGRKLGHITVLAEDTATLEQRVARLEGIVGTRVEG